MTVASGRRPDAGTLVPQQQGDGLELRAHGRRHAAAPGSRLDLTDRSGEHRNDIAAVVASLLPRGATASAYLALAWSNHRLLLWNAGHSGHGNMPHSPAAGRGNIPARGPGAVNAEPACGSPTINADGPRQAFTRPLNRRRVAGDHATGESRRRMSGSALGYRSC
jgi:hypothetical protein